MVISIIIMLALIAFVFFLNIPNPNMILIAGSVLCPAMFGFGGGTVAAVIMFFYTLFFFSKNHSFTQFSPENVQKVIVSLAGILADMLFVCYLKQSEVRAFKEVDDLTKKTEIRSSSGKTAAGKRASRSNGSYRAYGLYVIVAYQYACHEFFKGRRDGGLSFLQSSVRGVCREEAGRCSGSDRSSDL